MMHINPVIVSVLCACGMSMSCECSLFHFAVITRSVTQACNFTVVENCGKVFLSATTDPSLSIVLGRFFLLA
jgi:hypothetical protein